MPRSKNQPQSEQEVLDVMIEYCKEKNYNFSKTFINYMATDCYLFFEAKGWKGIAYWPAVAKRWVLNNRAKRLPLSNKPYNQGKSIKNRILENE